MKKLFISAVYCALHLASHAQTAGEWWSQQKTRIQYLIQQAAALLAYRLTAEKGWQIAGAGIDTIVRIDSGEFNLHQQYFQSLRTVNPVIKNSPLIGKIQTLQASMTEELFKSMERWYMSAPLDVPTQDFISRLEKQLCSSMLVNLTILTDLLTDGVLTMTDGERIALLQDICSSTQKQYRAVRAFSRCTDQLVNSRDYEARDLAKLKKLLYE